MDKELMKPVAWRYMLGKNGNIFRDTIYFDRMSEIFESEIRNIHGLEVSPLYAAPHVPRDVLMAFGNDVQQACAVACIESNGAVPNVDLAAIADRYASQVQHDSIGVTLEEVVSKLKAGENGDAISEAMTQAIADMALGRAIREGRAKQPELVNQQLLAAMKELIDMDVAYQRGLKVEQAVEAAKAAIAAAEAAQQEKPKWPDFRPQLSALFQAVEAYEKAFDTGYSDAEWEVVLAANHDACIALHMDAHDAAVRYDKTQQLASAQPVAVPSGWKIERENVRGGPAVTVSKFDSKGGIEFGVMAKQDAVTIAEEVLFELASAMLSAVQKPEGVK